MSNSNNILRDESKDSSTLFFISSSKLPNHSLDKLTLIRGRIESFYFPSTLYEDYINIYPNKNVRDFLYKNDLDKDVISKNLSQLNENEIICLNMALNHDYEPLTYRSLAKEISEKNKTFSNYLAQEAINHIDEMGVMYLIDRFDIKRNKIVAGKLVYPIDNRFYNYFNFVNDFNKRMISSAITKLLYDGWSIQKGIYTYISQRNKKTFNNNTDAGFIVRKNNQTFILFITETIDEKTLNKVKLTPSLLPKIMVSLDVIDRIQFDSNGLIHYSFAELLKDGLKIYDQ